MSAKEGCRRRDSGAKAGPVWDTRMKPVKTKGRIKSFHDDLNSQQSSKTCCSSSSIEDERMSGVIVPNWKRKAMNSSCDGIKKSPARIKRAATFSSSSSPPVHKGIGEDDEGHLVKLRKLKSELSRSLDEELKIDEDVVVESNSDTGRSPDGIASGSVNVCQEMAIAPVEITSKDGNDDDEEDQQVDTIEENKLVLSNERSLPIDATAHPNQPKTKPGIFSPRFHQTPTTQTKLQNFIDLIMWRDASKSALVFGIGAFVVISSSHTWDSNISFISVVSYLGLVYLAAVFLFRSYISGQETTADGETNHEDCVVGEEDAVWLMKLVLPYVNEFLLNLRALFSGDPITTIKLAVLLFILARYGGSITIWKLAKLGFVGVFTVPKACSAFSSQLTSFGVFWVEKFCDAWKSCSHKKAVGFTIFGLVWNVSSVVVRLWTLFVLFVAFKCYQQSFVKECGETQEETMDEI